MSGKAQNGFQAALVQIKSNIEDERRKQRCGPFYCTTFVPIYGVNDLPARNGHRAMRSATTEPLLEDVVEDLRAVRRSAGTGGRQQVLMLTTIELIKR